MQFCFAIRGVDGVGLLELLRSELDNWDEFEVSYGRSELTVEGGGGAALVGLVPGGVDREDGVAFGVREDTMENGGLAWELFWIASELTSGDLWLSESNYPASFLEKVLGRSIEVQAIAGCHGSIIRSGELEIVTCGDTT